MTTDFVDWPRKGIVANTGCLLVQEYKIHNADVLFKEDCTADDLIDVIEVRLHLGTSRIQLHMSMGSLPLHHPNGPLLRLPRHVISACWLLPLTRACATTATQ